MRAVPGVSGTVQEVSNTPPQLEGKTMKTTYRTEISADKGNTWGFYARHITLAQAEHNLSLVVSDRVELDDVAVTVADGVTYLREETYSGPVSTRFRIVEMA